MKNRAIVLILGIAALAGPIWAQTSELPAPSPIEKELAARASSTTEVTLGKSMLAFASKFMIGKDRDEAATRQLIEGLDGIYVREYEFDKEGEYSAEEVEALRKYFETSEWSPMVRERDRKHNETTDVMIKLVNGESHGLFILEAEPKELTIVLILGPMRMEDLAKLNGVVGLGDVGNLGQANNKEKLQEKAKEKAAKEKAKTGDIQ